MNQGHLSSSPCQATGESYRRVVHHAVENLTGRSRRRRWTAVGNAERFPRGVGRCGGPGGGAAFHTPSDGHRGSHHLWKTRWPGSGRLGVRGFGAQG
jgi:hypothetical protein